MGHRVVWVLVRVAAVAVAVTAAAVSVWLLGSTQFRGAFGFWVGVVSGLLALVMAAAGVYRWLQQHLVGSQTTEGFAYLTPKGRFPRVAEVSDLLAAFDREQVARLAP